MPRKYDVKFAVREVQNVEATNEEEAKELAWATVMENGYVYAEVIPHPSDGLDWSAAAEAEEL